MKFKFNVTIKSPDGKEQVVLTPVVTFSQDINDYGNGYYAKIDGAGLGFFNIFDCRYDKRLDLSHPEPLRAYCTELFNDIWTGKNGAWSVSKIVLLVCY